jgi:putative aminopeptidase FrvX
MMLCAVAPHAVRAQAGAGDAIASWVALNAPPGWEHTATPALRAALNGWRLDQNGNWIRQIGAGSPHRVVACSIDRPSYVVSEIRRDGWLRVQTSGRAPSYALWAQQHEGQRATILTRAGTQPAVFATPSTHLLRGRTASTTPTTADDLYVDVGATDAAAVAAMGIRMLDPVVRDWPAWSFNGAVAGMMAGARAGCAAIASVAEGTATGGRTTFIIGTLGSFGNQGIGAALARLGSVDAVTIVAPGARTASQRRIARPAYVPRSAEVDSITVLTPAVRWPGALTETISVNGADSLRDQVAVAAGVAGSAAGGGERRWVAVPAPAPAPPIHDSLSAVAEPLSALANLYGVSGHEHAVRAAILERLPAWARDRAKTDEAGNIIVAFGPDRDTAVILGHMDETGYEVQSIAGDGTIALRALGGMQQSLWEGQPALLHFDAAPGSTSTPDPIRGVFVPRDQADTKQPRGLTAWFGLDSAALVRAGVKPGMAVTSPKRATRIGRTRLTARALDDRAGSTAMLLAIAQLDPARVQHKVIFIWTVEEETGLSGAAAVAARFGTSVHIAYSIDTFVSSDSPLESTRYAFAPLGAGAVLRALDSSSTMSPAEIDRILDMTRSAGLQLHENTTSGGTDGSTMLRYGALQTGVSWPGRYSHSPVEVLDLRDLHQLARVIVVIATH